MRAFPAWFTVISLSIVLFAGPALAQAIGFGRATTGGAGGAACHVRDEASLRACVTGDKPAMVTVDAPVTFNPGKQRIEIGSNKTVDGRGNLSLVHDWFAFELKDAHNVIIRDVRFRGSGANLFAEKHSNCAHPARPVDVEGCGVSISLIGATANVWIDHNSFETCGNKCIVGYGYAPPTGTVQAPDLITISNNVFRDSYFAILFGIDMRAATEQLPPRPGRVTVDGNLFERIKERSPRAASGYRIHVFNNVIKDWGGRGSSRSTDFGFGPSVISGGEILLQNNVIEAWPDPAACKEADDFAARNTTAAVMSRGRGLIASSGNLTLNGAAAQGADEVFTPDYPFSLLPAREVAAFVAAHAGIETAPAGR